MKRFALIGHPVAQSLSPRLFAAAYGGKYSYELLDGEDFGLLWQRFLDEFDGINVTAPYKLDAFAKVDFVSEGASLCGAVNLAVKTPEGIKGYNTDVDGVVSSVQECGVPVKKALVVGCGGAGRAAAVGALRLGCTLRLWNRSYGKAQALAEEFGAVAVDSLEAALSEADLLIYTLPGSAEVPPALSDLSGKLVLEAEYKTPRLASVPSLRYLSGKRWLLGQAVSGYALFTGEEPLVSEMEKFL